MSYPKDLDEYDDEQLLEELRRRYDARKAGRCDYCGRTKKLKSCRYEARHVLPPPREEYIDTLVESGRKGPKIKGTTQVQPGVYVVKKSYSLFDAAREMVSSVLVSPTPLTPRKRSAAIKRRGPKP